MEPAPKRRKLERSGQIVFDHIDDGLKPRGLLGTESHLLPAANVSSSIISSIIHLPEHFFTRLLGCLDISSFARLSLANQALRVRLWLALPTFDDTRLSVISKLIRDPLYGSHHLSSLKDLSLSKCRFEVDDEEFQLICERFPSLTRLDLSWCHTLTQNGTQHLSKLTQLEDLSLRGCRQVNCSLLQETIGSLPCLKRLDLSHIRKLDALYEDDFRKLTGLETLELEFCPFLTNLAVVDALQHLTRLQTLNMSGDTLITGYLLPTLVRDCTQLTSLDIAYCTGITTPPDAFLTLSSLHRLTRIDVGGCDDDRAATLRKVLPPGVTVYH